MEADGIQMIALQSPFRDAKAKKNKSELKHMRSAFARADRVVYQLQQWLSKSVVAGKKVTEADVDVKIRALFVDSGSIGLSFKPICAAGKNGAVIHYGSPDNKNAIKQGTLFLIDTGAYYEGGYATDLTRTFLIGDKKTKATKEQKFFFTLVLKGAIAGMSARFPRGTTGVQLDAMVRQPMWRAGYNFQHGTGHGVGVNVHEFPPRISPVGKIALEPGHVFSIEPGVYIASFGGIRIENLCTIVDDPANRDYLRVLPLCFSPLDPRLIEEKMLSKEEKRFLKYYSKCAKLDNDEFPPLPPDDTY